MKLLVKFSTMCCRIRKAELNIIERLEGLHIDPGVLDDIVDVVSEELDNIIKER